MEILVCTKQVPDDSVEIRLDEASGQPATEGVEPIVNAFDTYALEMAAQFLETGIEGEITVAAVGDEESKNGIKNCLAVGASHGYVISDPSFEGSDAEGTGYILMQGAKKIETELGKKFDIIFCGQETSDYSTGQTGPQLAEELGYPLVTDVIALEQKGEGLSVKQETEDGYNMVDVATPCILTASKPNYDPRYPTIKNKMAARRMPIDMLSAADIECDGSKAGEGAALIKTVSLTAPPKRKAGVKINEEDIEAASLKAIGMMTDANVL